MNLFEKIAYNTATLADQEEALKKPWTVLLFAKFVPGADIEKCQEVACRDPMYAYRFACDVESVNIEKCQEAACKVPKYAYKFVHSIPGADIKMSIEACKGTEYEDKLNRYLMDKALL